MSNGQYLTYDEFLVMFDHEDIISVAGIGGYNGSAPRTPNRPRIEKVLARAASRVDGYVLAQFPTLAGTASDAMPEALKGACGDMVWYWLRDREGDRGTVDSLAKERFSDAIKYLESIQSGKVDLGIKSGKSPDGNIGGISGSFPESRSDKALNGYLS